MLGETIQGNDGGKEEFLYGEEGGGNNIVGGMNENSLYSCLCWKMGGTMHHTRTVEGSLCYSRGGTGEKGGGGIRWNVGIRVTAWIGWN